MNEYNKNRKLELVKLRAKLLGLNNWDTLEVSNIKNKRFSITSPAGYKIHFGLYPFKGKGTFIDHLDENIRKNWKARHSKILKDGKPAYLNKESPEFYSWYLLW